MLLSYMDRSRLWEAIGRLLRLEAGRPPDYYRDMLLGLVLMLSTLVAVALSPEWPLRKPFWVAFGISACSIALAKRRRGLIAIALAFVAFRLLIGFLLFWRPSLLAGALVFGAAAFGLGRNVKDF